MSTPPREDLCRASFPGAQLRIDADAEERGGMPTLFGHFTVTNQWAEIRSRYEGHFLERFATGSLIKTAKEQADRIRIMFQHGKDPQIGEKLLGVLRSFVEDQKGGLYEVPLFDTSYNRDLLPGLEAGAYGASMRFTSLREEWVDKPGESAYNPNGLPERTIKEARIAEAGPVVWPAYDGATAGVRSITDLIHDVDTVLLATPILLDEERLGHATAWIRRDLSIIISDRAEDQPDDTISSDAPPVPDADPAGDHLERGRRVTPAAEGWWRHGEEEEVPSSWR